MMMRLQSGSLAGERELCGWVAGAEGDRDDLARREEALKIPGCLPPREWAEIWTEEDLCAKVADVAHCPRVAIVGQGQRIDGSVPVALEEPCLLRWPDQLRTNATHHEH